MDRAMKHKKGLKYPKVALAKAISLDERILTIRGHKVILDADLAEAYGVTTKRLNEQTKRNRERFPLDFCFQLTQTETPRGGRKLRPPLAVEIFSCFAPRIHRTRRHHGRERAQQPARRSNERFCRARLR